jgi:hypothetical protein
MRNRRHGLFACGLGHSDVRLAWHCTVPAQARQNVYIESFIDRLRDETIKYATILVPLARSSVVPRVVSVFGRAASFSQRGMGGSRPRRPWLCGTGDPSASPPRAEINDRESHFAATLTA